jgi:FkbM family methyltransferase
MSRKITSLLYHTTNVITLPMVDRVRFKTKSGLISKIQKDLSAEVATRRGSLKILSHRGKNMAAAVSGFETDEPEMLNWIDSFQAGDTFWDIGANIGVFTMYAALRKDLNILAFEPNGLNFGITIEHLVLNKLDQYAQCFCIAFAQKTEIGHLVCSDSEVGQAGNNLVEEDGSSITKENTNTFKQAVPVFSIDDFVKTFNLTIPDHVKLDVDGLEHIILRGGAQTLSQIKSLMIEIEGDEARRKDLLDLVLATGLKERDISGHGGKGRNRLFTRA